ncbi:MOSC domain-containing protein [Nonomuraea sp. SBT364]|uniref:MOSC domain-containing protein n=1 Tax=Nonomuraea sp. SBT364 TaxID=1580530 RepID=UPI0007C71092|nr:MOSC N-terminal beta barrel domain-containing protein [Nonomuraea sp. SBT364]
MELANIYFYPVKSTSGHELPSAEVEPWGLAGDRRYVVIDEAGRPLTARDSPAMLSCVPRPDGDTITLTAPGAAPLRVTPTAAKVTIGAWRAPVELTDCGDDAAAWVSALIGRPGRLARLDDPTQRPVNPAYGRPEDRVSLADAYPLLLTTTASLEQLNTWVTGTAADLGEPEPAPLSMRRFRPSVVVEGAEPFAEDGWKRIRIGEVEFRGVKLCDRCVLTTVDPDTWTKGKEPIRTLARHRKWDGKTWFGLNLIPDGAGTIRRGDPVTVL